MGPFSKRFTLVPFFILISCACLLFVSGCARYSHNVNALYQPTTGVRGGSGEIYIVIPENRPQHSSDIKWVLGKVKDDDNNTIDEVFSPRSPAEIIQEAFAQEFRNAGYTVLTVTTRPAADVRVLDLSKTIIELDQISDLADLKATCRVVVGVDVYKNGQQIKRLQYESMSTKTDIRDRDMIARNVLEDALRSVMREAMPDLHNLLKR
jgi:hypothetical protein